METLDCQEIRDQEVTQEKKVLLVYKECQAPEVPMEIEVLLALQEREDSK